MNKQTKHSANLWLVVGIGVQVPFIYAGYTVNLVVAAFVFGYLLASLNIRQPSLRLTQKEVVKPKDGQPKDGRVRQVVDGKVEWVDG